MREDRLCKATLGELSGAWNGGRGAVAVLAGLEQWAKGIGSFVDWVER